MHYRLFQPDVPAKEVPAWELAQRRILAEDRENSPAFVRAIKAMQVAPRRVRGA